MSVNRTLQQLTRQILEYGLEVVGCSIDRQAKLRHAAKVELFRSNYGVGPAACAALYFDLLARVEKPNMRYFLVSLHWLKAYPTDIQQELRARKERPYWMAPAKRKKRKRNTRRSAGSRRKAILESRKKTSLSPSRQGLATA